MAKGIVREDFSVFRNSLYWFLGSSVLSGFLFSIRTGLHFQQLPGGLETPLVVMSLALGLISVLGISYYYIHTVMPEVFVKAAVFFSITLLLANGLSIFPPRIGRAASDKHRFIEAAKYKQTKEQDNLKGQKQEKETLEVASNP